MSEHTEDFIAQGLRCYHGVFRTIRHFEELVRTAASESVRGRLGNLTECLGIDLSGAQIKPASYDWPTGELVGIEFSTGLRTIRTICTGVFWELSYGGVYDCFASVNFKAADRLLKERLLDAFRNLSPSARFKTDNPHENEVEIVAEIQPLNDAGKLTNLFTQLLDEWIRLFRAINFLTGCGKTSISHSESVYR
jgi:hypothetical protein